MLVMKELERPDLSKEERERWKNTLTLQQTLTLQDKQESNQQYYIENKQDILKKKNQKQNCRICGALIPINNITRHYKTKDCRIAGLIKENELLRREIIELKKKKTDPN